MYWLILTTRQPRDGVFLYYIKERQTNSSAYVFKDFNAVIRSRAIVVELRCYIRDRCLRFLLPGLRYYLGCQVVNATTRLEIALKGVAHHKARWFVKGNAPTAFPREVASLVFNGHQLLWEAALGEIKVKWVHAYQFRKEHVGCLFLPFQSISKYEATFLHCMSM